MDGGGGPVGAVVVEAVGEGGHERGDEAYSVEAWTASVKAVHSEVST